MDFLGIGPLEVIFILIITLIVIGPHDMIKTGQTLGRLLRRLMTSPSWKIVQETSQRIRQLPNTLAREAGVEEMQRTLKSEFTDFNRQNRISPFDPDPVETVDLGAWTDPTNTREESEDTSSTVDTDPGSQLAPQDSQGAE